jgi:hypothetical protein
MNKKAIERVYVILIKVVVQILLVTMQLLLSRNDIFSWCFQ